MNHSLVSKTPLALACFMAALSACGKSPVNIANSGALGTTLGGAPICAGGPGIFYVFCDELKTGGGSFEYPGSDYQSLSFFDASNPISHRSIRYSWTGQDVSNPNCLPNPEHTFAGFDLMHTTTLLAYPTTPGRDLRGSGYTHASFFARGSLSTNTVLKVEVAGAGSTGACSAAVSPCLDLSSDGSLDDGSGNCGHAALSAAWQSYSISMTNPDLSSIKDFFKATFIFLPPSGDLAPGQGGAAYFDVIEYQQ
ncbi:MAG TPA: hypothetical protein VMU17_05675 [Elusimicrobiota bacterium]|nr:hypothetical protein [Elusimicrobiota bacterium]